MMLSGKENEPVTVAEAMPFVGEFLDSAESFWREGSSGRLRSEAFTIVDSRGTELGLVASALVIGHRHLLAIELSADFDERRRALQSARENVLEHDEHVRRTGALLDAARGGAGPGRPSCRERTDRRSGGPVNGDPRTVNSAGRLD